MIFLLNRLGAWGEVMQLLRALAFNCVAVGQTCLGRAERGKRYGRPPHTGVPKIGGRPYHSPRDVLGRQIWFGGHRRQMALFIDAVQTFLDFVSPPAPAPAQGLALAADDFGYSRMRRPPKTAAVRVHTHKATYKDKTMLAQ